MPHNNRPRGLGGANGLSYNGRDEQFEAYDQLDPRLQRALQRALLDYGAPPQLDRSQQFGVDWCIANIAESDRTVIARGVQEGIWNVRINTSSKRFKESLTSAVLALRGRGSRKNRRHRQ